MMTSRLKQWLFTFVILCSLTDGIGSQIQDRLIAGQLLYGSRKFGPGAYAQYLTGTNSYLATEYFRQCNWGFYIKVDGVTKTPSAGFILRF